MPRKRKNNSERVAQLEARVREYEAVTARLCGAATHKPVLPRGSQHPHQQWDWNCGECGQLVYAGRQNCFRYSCDGRRRDGATVVGSIRGQYCGSSASSDIKRQLAAINAPSNYYNNKFRNSSAQENLQQKPVRCADTLPFQATQPGAQATQKSTPTSYAAALLSNIIPPINGPAPTVGGCGGVEKSVGVR